MRCSVIVPNALESTQSRSLVHADMLCQMPLLMMDERGIIRRFNKAACSLTGFKHPNEVLGMNVRQLIESEYAQHNESKTACFEALLGFKPL